MHINISDLRDICEKLFSHLENEIGQKSIEIEKDYYWNIPEEQLYDFSSKPTNFDAGQISDEWQELKKILTEGRQPLSYDLVWLAPILRAIGEKVVR